MKVWEIEDFPHLGRVAISVLECFSGSDGPP